MFKKGNSWAKYLLKKYQLRGTQGLNLLWSVILTKSNYIIRPAVKQIFGLPDLLRLVGYFKKTSAFVVYTLFPQDTVHDKRFFLIKVFGKLKMA